MDDPQPSASAAACCLQHDVLIFLINTHMGTMHHFNYFTINSAGFDTLFFPDLLLFFGCTLEHGKCAFLLAKLGQGIFAKLKGDFIFITPFNLNAENLGHLVQFINIFDLMRSFTLGRGNKTHAPFHGHDQYELRFRRQQYGQNFWPLQYRL